MTDFYPLLARAIAGLPENTPAARQAVYTRALEALDRQLRAFKPALGEAKIAKEMQALDEVIKRLEAEAARSPDLSSPPAPEMTTHPASGSTDPAPLTPEIVRPPSSIAQPPAPAFSENIAPAKPLLPPQAAGLPAASVADGPPSAPELTTPEFTALVEPVRPQPARRKLDLPAPQGNPRRRLFMAAAIALPLMAGMAMLALSNREDPGLYKNARSAEAPDMPADIGKTENRLASTDSPAAAPVPPLPVAPPARSETSPAPAKGSPATTAVPIVHRAFMVLEARGGVANQFEGQVSWAFGPAGKTGLGILKASTSFSGANLDFEMNIEKNTDATLNASHTILFVFSPKDGQDNISEMSAIEWRERESQQGTTLAGLIIPIRENFFMMGLDKSDAATARNLDLLRNQKWMVFEMRFANGRRAAVLVEKGPAGDRAVNDALTAWK